MNTMRVFALAIVLIMTLTVVACDSGSTQSSGTPEPQSPQSSTPEPAVNSELAEISDSVENTPNDEASPPLPTIQISDFGATISGGHLHIVGLRSDGTVVSTRNDDSHDISDWRDIVSVSAGSDIHSGILTVGLKSDGTVVTSRVGNPNVSDWHSIVMVSTSMVDGHIVGLKDDGTVVAVGDNSFGQCDVSEWRDIVAISAGKYNTFGIKSDGTVMAAGRNDYGELEVFDWCDIVAISAGNKHTVGLKSDGAVVAVGTSDFAPECRHLDVSDWRDIVAVSAGWLHTVGLKSDGTVISTAMPPSDGHMISSEIDPTNVAGWSDIVAVFASSDYTIGLKSDGTMVSTMESWDLDISDWHDIAMPHS